MQAVGGRVETAIQGDLALREHVFDGGGVGDLCDQAPGLHVLDQGGGLHGLSK